MSSNSKNRAAASKKIIRPWLADPGGGSHEEEVYLADPWLQDPPGVKKMFTLAGFVPSAKVSLEQIRSRKEEIITNIRYEKYLIDTDFTVFAGRKLGGEVIETDEWDDRVTHVIAHIDGKKESMSEKVMAGLAAGRWVLTRRFVEKCVRRGDWLPSPALFITNDAVVRHRKGLFTNYVISKLTYMVLQIMTQT